MQRVGPPVGGSISGGGFGGSASLTPGYQRTASGNLPKPFPSQDLTSAAIVAQLAESQDVAVEARRSLAYLATLCLLCIYAAPTVISLHLAVDPDSAFWIGRYGYLALLAPASIVGVHLLHIAHLTAGGRSQMAFVISTLVPVVTFFLVGSVYMVGAQKLDLTAIEECSREDTPAKLERLAMAYAKGSEALDACASRAGPGLQRPTLDKCQEWTGEAPRIVRDGKSYTVFNKGKRYRPLFRKDTELREEYGRELQYLATTEAGHACSSFCTQGPMLWHSPGSVVGFKSEPCAPFVAEKLRGLYSAGAVVLWSGLIGGAVFIGLLAAAGRLLSRAGYV